MGRTLSFARSARGPAIIFGIVLALVIALTVLWNVVLSRDYLRIKELALRLAAEEPGAFHWTFIALGSSLFVLIIVLLSVLGAQLFAEIKMNQRQSAFIATVTHELNSPLASIKLYAQTLRNPGLSPDERARFLETMLADVERLRTLIANVLRAAQVEAGQLGLLRERVDVREYLERYAAETAGRVEKRAGGSLALAPGDGATTGPVELDPPVFRQVLDNLVDNSIKYRREGAPPRIEIAVVAGTPGRNGAARVAIEVRDDGIGIPRAALASIFERFRRVEAPRDAEGRGQQGTGLGLSIARALVEAHGGAISARSEGPGAGTTIRIELPVAEAGAVTRGV